MTAVGQRSCLLFAVPCLVHGLTLSGQSQQWPNVWGSGAAPFFGGVPKAAQKNSESSTGYVPQAVEESDPNRKPAVTGGYQPEPISSKKVEKESYTLSDGTVVDKEFERPASQKSKGYDFATSNATSENGCPVMPASRKEWEDSYLWGVFIDGKDVKQGPHVYDWDMDFFKHVSRTLSGIYAKEGSFTGKKELDQRMVEHFRAQTYGDLIYTPPKDLAAKGIMPECTNKMQCEDVKSLLQRIPPDYYDFDSKSETERRRAKQGCPLGLQAKTHKTKDVLLGELIDEYNSNIKEALGNNKLSAGIGLHGETEAETKIREKMLEHLVAFLRGFAFLHTFQGGNGRLRNMLLQRELRRLGLGCGTMMYNYNKDAFVDGFPRYLAKVKDGIHKFEEAYQSRKNPWTKKSAVEAHEKEFGAITGLEKCSSSNKQFGSGGNIALHREA